MDPAIISLPREGVSSDAQRRVLTSPDLLLIILSQLPHSSLFKAKQVNKTWASLFRHAEIRAALFQIPRPKGSALYVETYSDILVDKFSTFWPINGGDKAIFLKNHNVRSCTPPDQKQWGVLLVVQPPIEALELVQVVKEPSGETLEFRTVIPCPNGLRMGLLYDALGHWHATQDSPADLLWNRRTGDLVHDNQVYLDGTNFKTIDDKPCLTIYGNLDRASHPHATLACTSSEAQTIWTWKDKPVKYCMSKPKRVDFIDASIEPDADQGDEDEADQED